jgi:hypothetical protein
MATVPGHPTDRMTMGANCYPFSAFSATNGTLLHSNAPFTAVVPSTGSVSLLTWQADAATILTGIGGRFAGGGEVARISNTSNPSAFSSLNLTSQQSDAHQAEAQTFFIGVPGGTHIALFVGPNGVGNLAAAGEWVADFDASQKFNNGEVNMASLDEAFCYLSKVSGHWGNSDSFVQIFQDFNHNRWVLNTGATGSNTIHALARCYRLNQQ